MPSGPGTVFAFRPSQMQLGGWSSGPQPPLVCGKRDRIFIFMFGNKNGLTCLFSRSQTAALAILTVLASRGVSLEGGASTIENHFPAATLFPGEGDFPSLKAGLS